MNCFILDENINEIIDTMPYSLEYFLNVRPEDDGGSLDTKTESDSSSNYEDENEK